MNCENSRLLPYFNPNRKGSWGPTLLATVTVGRALGGGVGDDGDDNDDDLCGTN